MDFLEKYTDKVKDTPTQVEIHSTLLELYLSHDLTFPLMSQYSFNGELDNEERMSKPSSNGKMSSEDNQARAIRHEKGLRLLRSAWPSDLDNPLYDVDLAIILCEMNAFREGLLFLYERMKLYKEVIACYMQAHDHEGLIACC